MSKLDKEELLSKEDVMLKDVAGILKAMDTIVEYETYHVVRDGKELFSFRVRGLTDEEAEECRQEATKTVRDKRLGNLAVPQEFNAAKFNSLMIVQATHPEDRAMIWDNKELWEKANVLAGWQLVDKVLKRGEKDEVIELIERLSGYNSEENESRVETLKN